MKNKLLVILLLILQGNVYCQFSSSTFPVSETFSQNKKYSIKSFSYDDEYPNLKGKSIIYKDGKEIYTINRSFDLYDQYFLTISNDGKMVAYFTNVSFYNDTECKNVTVYKDGKLFSAYNVDEFTSVNTSKEVCHLFYNTYDDNIIDKQKSNWGTKEYKRVFKNDVAAELIFLSENFILNHADTIYLTDSRKIVTIYDLKNGKLVAHRNFDSLYQYIKNYKKQNSIITYYQYPNKYTQDFEDSTSNVKLSKLIANIFNLEYIEGKDTYKNRQYKLYRIELAGYLNHNGKFEIEKIKCDSGLQQNKITDYISKTTFRTYFLPKELEKGYFKYFFGSYKNKNDSIAVEERRMEIQTNKKDSLLMETYDSLNGFYIPKNLEDAILQLDKKLNFETKKGLLDAAIKNTHSMFNGHGMPMGMWIRNNWGLNGSSRLKKYFYERGFIYSEGMSWIIIDNYVKWLNGKHDWQGWEKDNPVKNKS